MELKITRYIAHLNTLSDSEQINDIELEEKKRRIVKRICDLKVKLAKLREDEEFEDALKNLAESGLKNEIAGKFFLLLF